MTCPGCGRPLYQILTATDYDKMCRNARCFWAGAWRTPKGIYLVKRYDWWMRLAECVQKY